MLAMLMPTSHYRCFPTAFSPADSSGNDTRATLRDINVKVSDIQKLVQQMPHGNCAEFDHQKFSSENKDRQLNIAKCITDIKASLQLQVLADRRRADSTAADLSALCVAQQNTINWQGCIIANWQMWWDELQRKTIEDPRESAESEKKPDTSQPDIGDWTFLRGETIASIK